MQNFKSQNLRTLNPTLSTMNPKCKPTLYKLYRFNAWLPLHGPTDRPRPSAVFERNRSQRLFRLILHLKWVSRPFASDI